jgi:molybdate transport system substrate-binding protein
MTAPAKVSIFCATVLKNALQADLLPEFMRETGVSVEAHFAATGALVEEIDAGARPDVVIGMTAAMERLAADGVLSAGTLRTIVGSGIGLAVPPGTAVPDVSTTAALVETLVAARSVAYSRSGHSGVYFAQLLHRLGLAEVINARATLVDHGFTASTLLDGRADLAVQQMSELMSVPGVRIAGPLPETLQHYTVFSGGTTLRAGEQHDAVALLTFLTSPSANVTYLAAGLKAD